jgi:hypothetical protein
MKNDTDATTKEIKLGNLKFYLFNGRVPSIDVTFSDGTTLSIATWSSHCIHFDNSIFNNPEVNYKDFCYLLRAGQEYFDGL